MVIQQFISYIQEKHQSNLKRLSKLRARLLYLESLSKEQKDNNNVVIQVGNEQYTVYCDQQAQVKSHQKTYKMLIEVREV